MLLVLIVTLLAHNLTFAASIPVVNHSFELPGNTHPHTLGCGLASGCSYTQYDLDRIEIPGWKVTGHTGVFRPGGLLIFDNPIPFGNQVGWSSLGGFSQTLTEPLRAGMTYELLVDLASRKDFAGDPGFTIELLAGNKTLSSVTRGFGTLPKGHFTAVKVRFSSTVQDPQIGQPLGIRLTTGGVQSIFDNVRLEVNIVPEPSAWVLSLLSFTLGWTFLRRR